MSLRTIGCVMLLAVLSCGHDPIDPNQPPPDWMLGEFSKPGAEGVQTTAVERVVFTDDGLVQFNGLSGSGTGSMCTDPYLSNGNVYPWERDGDDVIVWNEGIGEDMGYWRLSYVDCNTISLVPIANNGQVYTGYDLYRGQLCLQFNGETCPEPEVECEFCETVWCDGSPPPACE